MQPGRALRIDGRQPFMQALRAARLEPKRLAFVKHDAAAAPWLLLAEGRKNRRPGLVVEPDILTGGSSAATRY